MEPILAARIATIAAGCAFAAYTDARTGLILDKITYPMVAIGIVLNLLELNWVFLGIGIATFAIGYAVYYAGKIGGGDVKLCTGIAFLLPLYGGGIFLLNALFAGSILAAAFYSVFFVSKYARKGIDWKENRQNMLKTAVFAAIIGAYFWLLAAMRLLNAGAAALLGFPIGLALVFMALERGIKRSFFLKKVALGRLEEDEVIAAEFLAKKIRDKLKLNFKGVLGEKEIALLRRAGIRTVPVYRGMPPFAPFILLGSIATLIRPDIIGVFFA